LYINEQEVGRAQLFQALGTRYAESMGIGRAFGSPVSEYFRPPFAFTGGLGKVKIEVK
jgi:hypothetical protein